MNYICKIYICKALSKQTPMYKLLGLIFRQMGSSDLVLRGATLCEVAGKGLGLVATRGEQQ